MTDDQVDEVVALLNRLFVSKEGPIGPTHRDDAVGNAVMGMWGAELCKHDYRAVMAVVRDLHRSTKWRPGLDEILAEMRKGRQRRALTEAKRLALAPAPGPTVAPERVDELMAPVIEGMRPIANVLPLAKSDDQARVVLDRSMTAAMLLAYTEARASGGSRWAVEALAHVRAERERIREERTV